ncbi:MAG: arginine deiminase-related protein, partial [Mucilaginibacter sp.]
EIIAISFAQMDQFAGNMLELRNRSGESLLVMSQNAYNSLYSDQKTTLEGYCKLVYADIGTIENNGGGSARCMIAEVHLPPIM